LIRQGQTWTYRWHEESAGAHDEGELHCTVTRVVAWANGGAAGNLECDGRLAEVEWNPDFDPIGGVWGRASNGVWRLWYMPGEDQSAPYDQFIDGTEKTEPIEFAGEVNGTIRTYRNGALWCRREQRTDNDWRYELCFDREGIVRGEHQLAGRRVRFERAD